MIDFEIQRCTRRCAASDRELQPGEEFYSVLLSQGAEIVRLDYSSQAWQGPPENAVGWWKSQMPSATARKMTWAPHEVMLHYFEQLENQPESADLRYVLALLMVRRRILRLDDTEHDEQGEHLLVYSPANEQQYRVPVVTPDQDRAAELQQQLVQLLFGEAPS